MTENIEEILRGIKELLFAGLDYMKMHFDEQTLAQYMEIVRAEYYKSGFPQERFQQWIEEWNQR